MYRSNLRSAEESFERIETNFISVENSLIDAHALHRNSENLFLDTGVRIRNGDARENEIDGAIVEIRNTNNIIRNLLNSIRRGRSEISNASPSLTECWNEIRWIRSCKNFVGRSVGIGSRALGIVNTVSRLGGGVGILGGGGLAASNVANTA